MAICSDKPTANSFVEIFNRKFRECANKNVFEHLAEVRRILEEGDKTKTANVLMVLWAGRARKHARPRISLNSIGPRKGCRNFSRLSCEGKYPQQGGADAAQGGLGRYFKMGHD